MLMALVEVNLSTLATILVAVLVDHTATWSGRSCWPTKVSRIFWMPCIIRFVSFLVMPSPFSDHCLDITLFFTVRGAPGIRGGESGAGGELV